jgi:hypothetical protein
MAEGDVTKFNNFLEQLLLGTHNLDTNTHRVILMGAGYTPNRDTHATYGDVSAQEGTGTGYSAGGVAAGDGTVAQDNTNDRATFDVPDLPFNAIDIGTPSYAIMVRQGASATDAGNLLMLAWELGRPTNGGNYTLQWPNDVIRLS